MTKKELKKVIKLYKKKLIFCAKHFDINYCSPNFFIIYLNYLKDIALFSAEYSKLEDDFGASSLCYALNEYEEASQCYLKYFNIDEKTEEATVKDKCLTEEQANDQYLKERDEHLNNFFELIRDCLDMWIDYYGNKI